MRTRLVLFCLLLAVAGCGHRSTPEEQVRAVVAAAEQAAEARDGRALSSLVADDYHDGQGRSADDVRRLLRATLFAHQSIHLLVRIDDVSFQGTDLARVRASVAMLGREASGEAAWALAADVYEINVSLAREDGDWRAVRASWRRGP